MIGLQPGTVSQLARRYVSGGLNGAIEERPRPGRPPKITGEVEARLIALACETVEEGSGQKGQARWTLRMLAD